MSPFKSAPSAPQVRRPLRILEKSVYRGPHLFSARPMVRIQVDLGELEAYPTNKIEGFADRLCAALPGLAQHACSRRHAGGFLERLQEGTWLGHVAEHVALELQARAGAGVARGKTRSVRGRPGVYNILYAYDGERAGLLAGAHALALVDQLLPPQLQGLVGLDRITGPLGPMDADSAIQAVRRAREAESLGPTTAALAREAARRGIPVKRMNNQSLLRLGHGARQVHLRASITGRTSHIAVENASDKVLTKALLEAVGVPTPRGGTARTVEEAVRIAAGLNGPAVLKPLDGNHGRGVTTDLVGEAAVRGAFDKAKAEARRGVVIVEAQLPGRDHRILVVDGKVVAVAERAPAQVTGDGASSIRGLIEAVNQDPRRGLGHSQVMTAIRIDQDLMDRLARFDRSLDDVPDAGEIVVLRDTANLSTGGAAIDRTDAIHPRNADYARQAAAAVGLDVAGVDFLAPDISVSVDETGGGVVEVNAAPGFRMHLEPAEGTPRNVAAPVIDMLFPRAAASRIPIVAITGTNGKSTTVRMVAHILRGAQLNVGMTNTSGVYFNEQRLRAGDASGPRSAAAVLENPKVEVAVLETARGGILREGLAFDACDVGVVLNVAEDHLGLKGVDTVADLAAVKSVVVESVRRSGVSVLNADDAHTLRMAKHARGKLAYFSMRGGADLPGFLREHIAAGGMAVVRDPGARGGALVLHREGQALPVAAVADIAAALQGAAGFNVMNAMAAIAVCSALGTPMEVIRRGLETFESSFEQNPGRLNIFEGHPFKVIVDYAHNPAGLSALGEVLSAIRPPGGQVIGVVSIPGDRRDNDIGQMGELAASIFDEVVFREAPDGRGRAVGEVNQIMARGAVAAGLDPSRIHAIGPEDQAVEKALSLANEGDIVVLLPTSVEAVWAQVLAYRPSAVLTEGRSFGEASEHV
ncbi:cyanophycin synthetase [Phenylobacterium sp. Root77]|jgi:cyanophycin synthetase|uniref:cyanophycin synthetase n=1 Tax=unclassified Phenylobacterium TaxID=2640670 RepID=UPI000701B102|nr:MULTISPECIES: cyanophycin synthetase [unclassified Phenylobacterium]KQW66984.1 cyanophycin synthetase [Phenylobacterium sp. Root1277]KQW89677.1 cyanophycin synthetase [Phenylobacterium sp. Root1290]KRC43455.1 cyanophycin synthetase [Phenylobacterium sp. Root77]